MIFQSYSANANSQLIEALDRAQAEYMATQAALTETQAALNTAAAQIQDLSTVRAEAAV